MVLCKLRGHVFGSKDPLWSALQTAFAEIRPDQVQGLYVSLPSRMQAAIGARGGYNGY